MRQDLIQLSADEYHADPCDVPSLSSSIATVLDRQSPLHAYTLHPRLGGIRREPKKAFDHGSLSHALLLGHGKEVVIIDADDFRTKAARELRDAAHAEGRIPVLAREYVAAEETAMFLRQRFADVGIVLDGQSEVTALWVERTLDGAEVQCRGMMDHLKLPIIYDLKSCRSAHPEACKMHVDAYGYAIQRAAYVSALERIRPEYAGRLDFVLVFYELAPPFAVTPVRLSGPFRELGEKRWRRAVETWARCLREDSWPAYTAGVMELEPPPWAIAKDMDKQLAEARATWRDDL